MLRLHQIALSLADASHLSPAYCRRLAAARLAVPEAEVLEATVCKRSVDARDKRDVHFTLTLDVRLADPTAEAALLGRFRPNEAAHIDDQDAARRDLFSMPLTPYGVNRPRPVVVGAWVCAVLVWAPSPSRWWPAGSSASTPWRFWVP